MPETSTKRTRINDKERGKLSNLIRDCTSEAVIGKAQAKLRNLQREMCETQTKKARRHYRHYLPHYRNIQTDKETDR
jgi:hypothetical protein